MWHSAWMPLRVWIATWQTCFEQNSGTTRRSNTKYVWRRIYLRRHIRLHTEAKKLMFAFRLHCVWRDTRLKCRSANEFRVRLLWLHVCKELLHMRCVSFVFLLILYNSRLTASFGQSKDAVNTVRLSTSFNLLKGKKDTLFISLKDVERCWKTHTVFSVFRQTKDAVLSTSWQSFFYFSLKKS